MHISRCQELCVLFLVIWMRSYETGVVMSAVISRAVQNMKAGSCTMLHLFDFFSFFLHVFTLFQDLRATQILICMISVV